MLVLLVVAVAVGCAGDDDEPTGGSTDDAAPATSPAPTAPAATTGTTAPALDQLEAASVVAGDQHACALDPDGRAWCWGYGEQGQLGDGAGEDADVPVAVDTDATFSQLAAGRYFTCGITTDGPTLCWGDNSRGQLGDGATGGGSSDADRPSPVEVRTDERFAELAAGQLHVCAAAVGAGEVWCWGAYASGQLGVDVTEDQTTPVPAGGGIEAVALGAGGEASSCAIPRQGPTLCWGSNAFGQLGDGTTTNAAQPEPRPVAGGHGFWAVALGRTHACAIDAGDRLWCWGRNDAGQLGDGTTDDATEPVLVPLDDRVVQVTADDRVTCAVTDDGQAWCWGADVDGRLGDGSTDDATGPVAVETTLPWAEVSAGERFTCGRTTDDGVWCWGSNDVGWLGDGTGEDSAVPVPVAAP